MSVTKIIWPLVIVGRGSSAAYYLRSVDYGKYSTLLAIGEDDPWDGKRGYQGVSGDATLKINHPLHLLKHFGETIPNFSTDLVDRKEWAAMNSAVLEDAKVAILRGSVVHISRAQFPPTLAFDGEHGPAGFRIQVNVHGKGSKIIWAYKVVVCAGTGGHRVPDELKGAKQTSPNVVIDLDQFAALGPRELNPQTEVIVLGSNAAIDAPHKALSYGCKINWLIDLPEGRDPPILATQPRMREAYDDPAKNNLSIHRYSSYEVVTTAPKSATLGYVPQKSGSKQYVKGNYVVYGVGPDGATTAMIDPQLMSVLRPILDGSRAVTIDPDPKNPKQPTILGYEAEGTGLYRGLEIFGAISGSIGREIASSKDRMKQIEEQIETVRSRYKLFTAITAARFPVGKPFLARDPDYLARQPRAPLAKQLRTEVDFIVRQHVADSRLRYGLETLANLFLAYHTAHAYAAMGTNDPTSKANFRVLLNQVADSLPKGTVADHGQLTSINSALQAYATMNGTLPKYMPKQHYQTLGPASKNASKSDAPISGTTTKGDINFNLDNAQNLAIYVCLTYPNIPAEQANAFVDRVIRARRESKTGFTDMEATNYKKELARLDSEAISKAV